MSGSLQRSYLTGSALRPPDTAPEASMSGLEGTVTLDLFGTMLSCDARFERLVGRPADDLAGKSVTDVFPNLPFSSKSPEYNSVIVKVRSRLGMGWRQRLLRANGEHRYVEVRIQKAVTAGRETFVLEVRKTRSRSLPRAQPLTQAVAFQRPS
jgi:PAS domain S-box-containing protein